jgi:uncharacterized protein YndB with AHSA1/START domain
MDGQHDARAATDERLGELSRAGDRWQLRFTRHLSHPPDKVWRAITEPEHLAAWFPQRIVGERTPGAKLRFVGQGADFEGEVIAVNPPSVLEFTWGDDLLRFELTPEGDGSVLVLTDTFDEQGKGARDAAGWHECLDLLERRLAGEEPITWGQRWSEVHPRYVDRLGPDASTIGPPEGWEPPVDA